MAKNPEPPTLASLTLVPPLSRLLTYADPRLPLCPHEVARHALLYSLPPYQLPTYALRQHDRRGNPDSLARRMAASRTCAVQRRRRTQDRASRRGA
jgi:hypothetical protein